MGTGAHPTGLFEFYPDVSTKFYKMHGMESRDTHARKSLWLAVVISLLLHAAVLLVSASSPDPTSGAVANPDRSNSAARPPLLATIVSPLPMIPPSPRRDVAPPSTLRKKTAPPEKRAEQRILTAPSGAWTARSWSIAERTEMDQFLNELATQAAPPTVRGRELSQRAMAMAGQMGRHPQNQVEDEASGKPAGNEKVVEPFSLEMYFDAFVRKLNRSAAFVKNDPRVRGTRKALVEISLNSDGALKSFRVLRSADQEVEIAYIKNVLDRASPFSAFPPDIRNANDSLSIRMCIYPAHEGQGGGFSRSFGAQDCRD